MIKLLVKLFIKNYDDTTNLKVREKYGILGGILGIICNIFLFIIKLIIGITLNTISIMSDAFNNLTDSFSSIVSIISAKLSNKKPDKDHPFGHGRIEYLATLIVSFIIILVGIELLTSSIEKLLIGLNIIEGTIDTIKTGKTLIVSIVILSCSLLVKVWMYSYNKYLGKKINSSVLLASSADSISDALTSFAIILTTLIGGLLLKDKYYYLDSAMGIIVSIIICINGFKIISTTVGDLLGKPASKEDNDLIENLIMEHSKILGTHDLMIHDYGPGRKFASVHVEIDAKEDIVKAHELIDDIEKICYAKTNIELVIHMDPIDINSPEINKANDIIANIINEFDGLTFHDLRLTNGENNINVIFDLVVPHKYSNEQLKEIIAAIKEKVYNINPLYTLVIKIDRPY